MPNVKIRSHTVDIDVEGELRNYDWTRPRWNSDKLIAASPFRYDNTPSFYVNLEGKYAGVWGDSGAYNEDYASGGFVKLLAFLRQETYEETESYLLTEYGRIEPGATLKMPPIKLTLPRKFEALPESTVTPATSQYLLRRGITEEVQAIYGTGYGKQHGFTAIPWRKPNGDLANVKYRATRGKLFFYEKGAHPIRQLVYGIDVIHQLGIRTAAICEAEIDAMSYAVTSEVYGIAAGGVTFTEAQADIVKRSPIETLLLAGDNDKAGAKFNREVKRLLRGHVRFKDVDYNAYKDANEVLKASGANGLRELVGFSMSK
ncbi:toprim domain-containing protein [Bacillus sp. FSL K6-3431]|uniref:toprim domain-containing protein n=1 Tax=Bacillus sp. FSL K6-3431 TaxID=2921500 RepID=UPI0030FA4CFB